MKTTLSTNWQKALAPILITQQFQHLMEAVRDAYASGKTIYPAQENIFKALNYTALNSVKIIIIGQDPYHGEGQAQGLSFSVPAGMTPPPSLKNIFKALEKDLAIDRTKTDLSDWAEQGVLLLNAVLTVEAGKAGSHSTIGWQGFTDGVIQTISDTQEHVVFMLWGAYAQSKAPLINADKHLVLQAAHPSPLSAYRGFFDCQHFSKANKYLQKHSKTPVIW